jgi:hypothetical protein
MNKFLKRISIFLSMGLFLFLGFFVFSSLELFDEDPRFRTMQDKIASSQSLDLRGLREMRASGGAVPNFPELQRKLSHIKGRKIIIDAKAESPGYIAGRNLSFFRYDVSKVRPKHLIRRLYYTGTFLKKPEFIVTAQKEAQKREFEYAYVVIGSRYTAPDEKIDEIVALLDSIPHDTWIHIHCRNGHGRTSMLLTMLDMMRNAPTVSKEAILERQHLLGSVDFHDTTVWSNSPNYTTENLENRKKFIENFYEFISQRKNGGIQLWSEWNRQKNRVS